MLLTIPQRTGQHPLPKELSGPKRWEHSVEKQGGSPFSQPDVGTLSVYGCCPGVRIKLSFLHQSSPSRCPSPALWEEEAQRFRSSCVSCGAQPPAEGSAGGPWLLPLRLLQPLGLTLRPRSPACCGPELAGWQSLGGRSGE